MNTGTDTSRLADELDALRGRLKDETAREAGLRGEYEQSSRQLDGGNDAELVTAKQRLDIQLSRID